MNFTGKIKNGNVMDKLGYSKHVNLLVATSHSKTWFTSQGCEHPATSEPGSKLGDPLGDMIFNMVLTQVINKLTNVVRREGILEPLPSVSAATTHAVAFLEVSGPQIPDTPLIDSTFCDDTVSMLWDESAIVLVQMTSKFCSSATSVFLDFGLHLNFGLGKSEVIMNLRGVGVKKER